VPTLRHEMDASALSPASTYGELLVPKDWSVIGCSFIEEVNALKRLPWHTLLIGVAVFLVLVGVAPLAYLLWWGNAHNLEPLSVPLSLKRGEYTSPFVKTDLDDDYQIEIYFLPSHRTPLDLDWKIVDESGRLIQSGGYREHQQMGGNDAILERHYRPKRGSQQKIIVSIHQDVQPPDSDTRLHVGLPERGLEQAYGSAAAIMWAAIVAGAGAIMLLVVVILRVVRWQTPPVPQMGS
jgi:hypothetical protein